MPEFDILTKSNESHQVKVRLKHLEDILYGIELLNQNIIADYDELIFDRYILKYLLL